MVQPEPTQSTGEALSGDQRENEEIRKEERGQTDAKREVPSLPTTNGPSTDAEKNLSKDGPSWTSLRPGILKARPMVGETYEGFRYQDSLQTSSQQVPGSENRVYGSPGGYHWVHAQTIETSVLDAHCIRWSYEHDVSIHSSKHYNFANIGGGCELHCHF
jgi:hypothetical protein